MNLKKVSIKVLSIVMTLAMMIGVCAPFASAISFDFNEKGDVVKKDKLNYVSLGDSMTNGYGLDGYDGNSGVEDYGYGSYANIFAQWLVDNGYANEVDHAQLAMSGIRVEDLHWLLEFDYTDEEAVRLTEREPENDGYTNGTKTEWWNEIMVHEWNAKFTTGDFWTLWEICTHGRTKNSFENIKAELGEGFDEFVADIPAYNAESDIGYGVYGDVAVIAKYFQTKVAEGDIISLAVGNGNFGVYMFGRILEAVGFTGQPSDTTVYDVERAMEELDPEMKKAVKALVEELNKILDEYMPTMGETEGEGTVTAKDALQNTIIYTAISFVVNYVGTVERLLELNPDAEIILVALMNTFGDSDLGIISEFLSGNGTADTVEKIKNGELDAEELEKIVEKIEQDLEGVKENGLDFGKFNAVLEDGKVNAEEILALLTLGDLLTVVNEPLNAFIAAIPVYLQLSEMTDNLFPGDVTLETLPEYLKAETEKTIAEIEAKVEEDVANVTAVLEAEIKALGEKAEAEAAKLRAEAEVRIAALRAEAEAKIAEITASAEAKNAELEAQTNAQTAALNAAAVAKYNALVASLEAKNAEQNAQLDAQIAAFKAAATTKYNALVASLEAKKADLEARTEAQLAILNEELRNADTDAAKQLIADIANVEAQFEIESAEIEAEFDAAVAELNAQVEAGIAALNASAEAKAAEWNAEFDAAVAELNAQVEADLAALTATAEAKAAELDAELDAAVAELTAKTEVAIAEVTAEVEAAVEVLTAELEVEIAELRANAEANAASIRAQADAQIKKLLASKVTSYTEAKFYFAEAAKVECLVDVYGEDFDDIFYYIDDNGDNEYDAATEEKVEKGTDGAKIATGSIIRDRFYQSIVKDEDGDLGMVWGLVGGMNISGLTVGTPTFEEILTYVDMTYAEKVAYAANPANAANAMSIALYLGFENAVLGTKEAEVTLNSVLNLNLDPEMFGPVIDALSGGASTENEEILDAIYGYIAGVATATINSNVNGMLTSYGVSIDVTVTADEIEAVYTAEEGDDSAVNAIGAKVADAIVNAVAPVYTQGVYDQVYNSVDTLVLAGLETGINTQISATGLSISLTPEGYYNALVSDAEFDTEILVDAFAIDVSNGFATLETYIAGVLSAAGVETYSLVPADIAETAIDTFINNNGASLNMGAAKVERTHNTETLYEDAKAYVAEALLGSGTTAAEFDAYVTNMVAADLPGLVQEKVGLLVLLLTLPENLGETLIDTPAFSGLLGLFGRCVIGNGLGGHPSAGGHETIADAVISAYENNYTALDETMKNLPVYGAIVLYLVYENYDVIYAELYKKAVEEGLIEDINSYLDIAEKALDDAKAWIDENSEYIRSEEFGTKLDASLENARATLTALRELVNGADQLDDETYELALDLVDALYTNLVDVYELLKIAAVDADEYAQIKLEELKVQVEKQMAIAKAEAQAKLEELKAEAEAKIAELKAQAEAKIAELKAQAEKQIALVKAELEAKIAEIKAEAEKQIALVKAELEAKINALNEKVESEIARLTAEAEAKIAALKAQAEKQIAILEAELLQLNEQLKTAVGEAKAAIEAKIREIEAEIARIKAELEAKIAEIKAEAEAKIAELKADLEAAILALNAAVEAKIAELKAQAEATIAALKAELEAAIEAIKAELKAAIEAIEAKLNADLTAVKAWLDNAIAELNAQLDALLASLNVDRDTVIETIKAIVDRLSDITVDFELSLEFVDAIKAELLSIAEEAKAQLKAYLVQFMTGEYTLSTESFYLAIGNDPVYADLLAEALCLGGNFAVNAWGELDLDAVKNADLISIGFNENQLSNFALEQAFGYVANFLTGDFRESFVTYVGAATNKFLSSTTPSFGDSLVAEYVKTVTTIVNESIDSVANDYFGGASATELDWAALVGEENVTYVDKVRETINFALAEQGVEETFAYEIPVAELLYENKELLGEEFAYILNSTSKDEVAAMLGEYATYTVEIPVREALVFAGESYIYGYAQFHKEYSETVLAINETNPDATVVLLSGYNAFAGIEGLEDIYAEFAAATSIHPLTYAVLMDNVIYVDIMDAETVYGSYVAEGMEVNVAEFALTYLLVDRTITDLSEAGNEYVANAILGALEITCEHIYDDCCDGVCNFCGFEREPGHVWADATCDAPKTCELCGATEGDALGHDWIDATCTTPKTCNRCGVTEGEPIAHTFGSTWMTDANDHWHVCSCGEIADKAPHADTDKNGKCDVCGYAMTIGGGDVPLIPGPGGSNVGEEEPEGLSTGAIVGIVTGSTFVAALGGFAIFWFVVQKKSFADLLAVFKKRK